MPLYEYFCEKCKREVTVPMSMSQHDRGEAAAIRTLLDNRAASVPILNVKAGLGNNGAGSGAIDFIATVLAVQNATVPPAINSMPAESGLPLKLADKPIDARTDVAVSLAYSLGSGQNAALVVRRWKE